MTSQYTPRHHRKIADLPVNFPMTFTLNTHDIPMKIPWICHDGPKKMSAMSRDGRAFARPQPFHPADVGGIPEKIWVDPLKIPNFHGKSKENHRKNDHFHWNLIGV